MSPHSALPELSLHRGAGVGGSPRRPSVSVMPPKATSQHGPFSLVELHRWRCGFWISAVAHGVDFAAGLSHWGRAYEEAEVCVRVGMVPLCCWCCLCKRCCQPPVSLGPLGQGCLIWFSPRSCHCWSLFTTREVLGHLQLPTAWAGPTLQDVLGYPACSCQGQASPSGGVEQPVGGVGNTCEMSCCLKILLNLGCRQRQLLCTREGAGSWG